MAISGALIALQATGWVAPMPQYATVLRIISFAMALLLSYRLNRSYDRWWEARKAFSGIGSASTALAIQATTWVSKDCPQLLENFRRWTIVWAFSVKQVLEDAKELDPIASELLYPEELAVYKASRKGRQVVVTKLYQLIEEARVEADLPDEATAIMLETVANGVRSSGDCTRIHYQCMPIGIAYACGGFVQIWCYLFPFGVIQDLDGFNGQWYFLSTPETGGFILMLIALALAVLMLLGIDEVTNQLEHPYHLLPLEALAMTYHRDINRTLQEATDLMLATEAGMQRLEMKAEKASTPIGSPHTVASTQHHSTPVTPSAASTASRKTTGFTLTTRLSQLASARPEASRLSSRAREVPNGESEFDDFLESEQWKKLEDWRDAVLADSIQATGLTAEGERGLGGERRASIPSIPHLTGKSFKGTWFLPYSESVKETIHEGVETEVEAEATQGIEGQQPEITIRTVCYADETPDCGNCKLDS